MSKTDCPCGNGSYAQCCQILHLGQQKAQTAQQLMRSRYSAFAKHQIDYLLHTTALGQQAYLDLKAISDWSQSNQWQQLEVIQVQEKITKHHAKVEFKAHYHDATHAQIHHEISYFVRHQETWYFLDPTVEMKLTMKQACICGSGKKFKQCCAEYV